MRKTIVSIALAAALLWPVIAVPVHVFAEDAAEEDPLEDRAETFEAAPAGAQTENIPGGMLMVVAYDIAWVLVLAYVVSLGFRQAKTQADLERLRQDLAARPADDEG